MPLSEEVSRTCRIVMLRKARSKASLSLIHISVAALNRAAALAPAKAVVRRAAAAGLNKALA